MKSPGVWIVGLAIVVGIMWLALRKPSSSSSSPAKPQLTLAEGKAKLDAKPPKELGDVIPTLGEAWSENNFTGCKKDEYNGHANCTWVFTDGRVEVEAEHNKNYAKVLRVQFIEHK